MVSNISERKNMTLLESWIGSANFNACEFPLNNLPYGVFSNENSNLKCGVAIGDMVLDCQALEEMNLIDLGNEPVFKVPYWNKFMDLGHEKWTLFRYKLTELLGKNSSQKELIERLLVPQKQIDLHLPFQITEYTDFYASKSHATNVGTMFRGKENALPPNWLHIPIGYNGRASSVVVSKTNVRRPWGQLKKPDNKYPHFAPSQRFDFELELGAVVGASSQGPITVSEADKMIFGYVLLNDWSARDIQAWEYQPLGPFQSKATATSLSPWIVSKDALEPFRCNTPTRDIELLDHLQDCGPMLYDIDLMVKLSSDSCPPTTLTKTNYKEMYYSSAQQLAHHSSSGCPIRSGDLIGSGTISGSKRTEFGSMLELSWGGKEPLILENGEKRSFLEDFDVVTFYGRASNGKVTIGFGNCSGMVLQAHKNPFNR